jgi:hypothetical protein
MRALLLLLLEPGALYSAYPWDDAGHLPVAEIAYDRFSSALQPKLQGALAGLTECSHTYGAFLRDGIKSLAKQGVCPAVVHFEVTAITPLAIARRARWWR